MQYQTEILRFKEGARSRHPSPDATVAAAQANMLDAGGQIAVVVDLTPPLPYRSRELRSLVVKAYWTSSGSIVARLRRALAAANRHLVTFNHQAPSGSKCSGNLTCAVFSDNELFLGQVGAAYTYVFHPPDTTDPYASTNEFEIFPRRNRLLIPLGGTMPPIIHIGYTVMRPGSIACLATTQVAEAQAREAWEQLLMQPKTPLITSQISREFSTRNISGSLILIRAHPSPVAKPAPWAQPVNTRRSRGSLTSRKAPTPAPQPAPESQPVQAASLSPLPHSQHKPTHGASTATMTEVARDTKMPSVQVPIVQEPASKQMAPATYVTAAASSPAESSPKSGRPLLPPIHLSLPPLRQWTSDAANRWRERRTARKNRVSERATTVERARLRQALRTLLPGKIEAKRQSVPRTPPAERPSILAGVTLGITLIVALITIGERFYLGGAGRADELMTEVYSLQETAVTSQSQKDWQTLRDKALQVALLDPENTEAAQIAEEAQQILGSQANTSFLKLNQLLDLATSPVPRRILVAGGWVYLLNTATDTAVGLPLAADGMTLTTDNPTSILRRGQTWPDDRVSDLVDFAWLQPGGIYPDGAVLIYGDQGILFIYQPALGPGQISVQYIKGDLAPGSVTAMETYVQRFYLVNRQINQLLMYEPINGIYDRPRDYFAPNAIPDLYQIQDIAIDGRVYLLMSNSDLQTYFYGTRDNSFSVRDIPEGTFEPRVMAVDPDTESGYVYLADPVRERILVLDKQGVFVHQYRFPRGDIKRIEALTVSSDPRILYLIADNYLYSAPLPLPLPEPTPTP